MRTGLSRVIAIFRWLLLVGAAMVAKPGVAALPSDAQGLPSPLVVWQTPLKVEDDGNGSDCGPGGGHIEPARPGSRIVVFDPESGSVTNLTAAFAAVGRPDLSRDAKRLLFVGRRSMAERLAVWELSLGVGNAHPIVECPGECDRAIYLSTLLTLDAARPLQQIAIRSRGRNGGPAALFRCELNGDELHQITYAPEGVFDPLLLSDGRILLPMEGASASRGVDPFEDSQTLRNVGLFTMNPDGTDLFPFFVQKQPIARRHGAIETPGGLIVFVENPAGWPRAELVSVRRADPLRVLMRSELKLNGVHGLAFIDDRHVLAAGRLAGTQNESDGVFRIDLHNAEANLVFNDPAYHDAPAALLRPRVSATGRSSVVNRRTGSAQLYALDVNLSDSEFQANSPKAVARVRVHSLADDRTSPVVIGELAVERDGSFYVEMPARRPIALESMDSGGNSIRRMESYFWLMPGERRGCIGCHESRALAPPNRHVFALRKPPQRIGFESRPVDTHSGPDEQE